MNDLLEGKDCGCGSESRGTLLDVFVQQGAPAFTEARRDLTAAAAGRLNQRNGAAGCEDWTA
jgi:hypothetical protein